jgi:RND family efflux transporter MFP subunit
VEAGGIRSPQQVALQRSYASVEGGCRTSSKRTKQETKLTIAFNKKSEIWAAVVLIPAALVAAGCTRSNASAGSPRPPDVEVIPVQQKDIPIYREWIGTLDGMVNAVIRAQVAGYLLRQDYSEGSFVRKGQLLFESDPRPFQAAADQAQGQLAQANGQVALAKAQLLEAQARLVSAEANQQKTQLDVDRYIPLAQQQAITQQEFDNAKQNNLSAKAQVEAAKAQTETAKAQIEASNAAVEAAKAALETARVNLGFTRLTSPIDGIAGVAQIQIGNLVSPATNAITTVSTVDPIKVNFTVSEQEYLTFTRQDTPMKRLEFELILGDGSIYSRKGKFAFADRQVNQNTGAIQLTALFPNPGNALRPGQYGKVRAATRTIHGALLVPQPAVSELQGAYQVAVLDGANKVSVETVNVGDRVGSMWVIREGLKPGQRVVVEGLQKAVPGTIVNPKPFSQATEPTGGK